ncbi:MAG: hypothetical protein GY816_03685, partial [Cytophagales bacterium]|nr:hypothetical protein [Cytophagales bacterium]
KPDFEEEAQKKFPEVNVTTEGHKYLGSFIGTAEGVADFVTQQIESWVNDIKDLARIAEMEPQLAYSAFIYGTAKKWQYLMRTTPDINHLLNPLEHVIQEIFIPIIIGKNFLDDNMRKILALPAKYGGMSIGNVMESAQREYLNSVRVTSQLTAAIVNQHRLLNIDKEEIYKIKQEIIGERDAIYQEIRNGFLETMPSTVARQLELVSEPGVSCMLTTLPLQDYGFAMNKQEFHDYIAFRYNFKLSNVSRICGCNQVNSINHSLICKKGGYPILRHNSLCRVLGELLEEAGCKDVVIEPILQDLTGESLPSGANTSPNARLDVSCRSFWTPLDKVFTDIRIFHAQAPSNACMPVKRMYKHHEDRKKAEYNARVLNVEKGSFTPIVFNTTGGMGVEASAFLKRLAVKISTRKDMPYSKVISFVRRRLRFDLVKTTLIALRGYRGKPAQETKNIGELDIHLEKRHN